jgi:hypothetical protein
MISDYTNRLLMQAVYFMLKIVRQAGSYQLTLLPNIYCLAGNGILAVGEIVLIR